MSKSTISTFELLQMFPDQESARAYFEAQRWPDGAVCREQPSLALMSKGNGDYDMNQLHPMQIDRGLLVKTQSSAFAGGYVWGLNDPSREYLFEFFGEGAEPIGPLGGQEAHIVEPWQVSELAECITADGGTINPTAI